MTFVQPYFWSITRGRTTQRWGAVLVTGAAPVITVVDAKLHARLSADETYEDPAVLNWILAAQAQVETDSGLKFGSQTWDLVGDAFPALSGPIVLPWGPLISVTHVKSYDAATPSVLQTMTASDYIADVVSVPGRIGLADAATWPTDLRQFQPVVVRVVVGRAVAAIPEPLLHAVRLAVAWHAANREPTDLETRSYDWLLDPYRQMAVA